MATQDGESIASDPTAFLQHLALQAQVLACLQWLGDFQVLACIPLNQSVTFKDVGDLADVPVGHLSRIVRIMATVGFLREPLPECVAHSELSAHFVEKPSLLDAAMFLTETSVPSALHMAPAMRRHGASQKPNESPYNLALGTSATFVASCERDAKLQRRWAAFRRHVADDEDVARVTHLLMGLNWSSLGTSTIVEVGAQSTATATALTERCPSLHVVVQLMSNGRVSRASSSSSLSSSAHVQALIPSSLAPTTSQQSQCNPCITVQHRNPGMPQVVEGAAAYILHLPVASPAIPSHAVRAQIMAEIGAHVEVLRVNAKARLILVSRLLPEPGSVDSDVEGMARLYDLSLLQMANERELEVRELIDMLNDMRDAVGELVLVNKLVERRSPLIAFELRFHGSSGYSSTQHAVSVKSKEIEY